MSKDKWPIRREFLAVEDPYFGYRSLSWNEYALRPGLVELRVEDDVYRSPAYAEHGYGICDANDGPVVAVVRAVGSFGISRQSFEVWLRHGPGMFARLHAFDDFDAAKAKAVCAYLQMDAAVDVFYIDMGGEGGA